MAMKQRLELAFLLVVFFPLCKALTVQAQVRTTIAGPLLQGSGYVLAKHVSGGRMRHRSTSTPTPSPTPTRTPTPSPSPTPGGIAPIRASDFLNSLGVDTHIIQGVDSSAQVIAGLQYTGIRNIRDDATHDPAMFANLCNVHAATGAMVDELPIVDSESNDIQDSLAEYESLATCGAMLAAEGPNEPNNFNFSYDRHDVCQHRLCCLRSVSDRSVQGHQERSETSRKAGMVPDRTRVRAG